MSPAQKTEHDYFVCSKENNTNILVGINRDKIFTDNIAVLRIPGSYEIIASVSLCHLPSCVKCIIFERGVKRIETYALKNITSHLDISALYFPSTLKFIGEHAFDGCQKLFSDNSLILCNSERIKSTCVLHFKKKNCITLNEYREKNSKNNERTTIAENEDGYKSITEIFVKHLKKLNKAAKPNNDDKPHATSTDRHTDAATKPESIRKPVPHNAVTNDEQNSDIPTQSELDKDSVVEQHSASESVTSQDNNQHSADASDTPNSEILNDIDNKSQDEPDDEQQNESPQQSSNDINEVQLDELPVEIVPTLVVRDNMLVSCVLPADSVNSVTSVNVIIPEDVYGISSKAFNGCGDVPIVVHIPEFVSDISRAAFRNVNVDRFEVDSKNKYYCSLGDGLLLCQRPMSGNLILQRYCSHSDNTEYEIPNSICEISAFAFAHANNLQKVVIPNSVTKIADGAFYICKGINEYAVAADNEKYESRDGALYCKEADNPTLVAYPLPKCASEVCSSVFTPAEVGTTFSSYCMAGVVTNSKLLLPERCIIGDYAFACSSISCLSIPKSVQSIGSLILDGSTQGSCEFLGTKTDWTNKCPNGLKSTEDGTCVFPIFTEQ